MTQTKLPRPEGRNNRGKRSVRIEFWSDWIRISRDSRRNIVFSQSTIEVPDYHHRTIGIAKDERTTYYVAAAMHRNSEKGSSSRYSGRGLVAKRIKEAMRVKEIPLGVQMVTLLPENYLDFLWEDQAVYNSLYGKIDEDSCMEAIKKLSSTEIRANK